MKGERRHELERNMLADWIAETIGKVKPYQNAILGVVLLAVVAVAVTTWMSRRSRAETENAWDDLYAVLTSDPMNAAKFEEVADLHAGTSTAHWASVLAGEVHLVNACNDLFSQKDVARENLEKADELFRKVLEECRIDALRARATYGLAQVNECQGDIDKAIESWSSPSAKESGKKADRGYQGVVNLWPDGMYAKLAQRRLKELTEPSTLAFYDRFAKWEPKSPVAEEPGTPGVAPPTELTPPAEPVVPPSGEAVMPPLGPVMPPSEGAGLAPSSGLPQPDLDKKPAPKVETPSPKVETPAPKAETPAPESPKPAAKK